MIFEHALLKNNIDINGLVFEKGIIVKVWKACEGVTSIQSKIIGNKFENSIWYRLPEEQNEDLIPINAIKPWNLN